MMSRTGKVHYGEGHDYKAVKLPYGSGKTSMYCILPEGGIDINKFIENMSAGKWNDIRKNKNTKVQAGIRNKESQ